MEGDYSVQNSTVPDALVQPSKTHRGRTIVVALLLLVVVAVGGAVGFKWWTSRLSGTPATPVEARLNLMTDSSTVSVGVPFLVRVVIGPLTIAQTITGATVHLVYDPAILSSGVVSSGMLWSEANILQKTVDATNGEIRFSIGKGFNATTSADSTLATVTFTAIKPGNTQVKGGADTIIGGAGGRKIGTETIPLSLTISGVQP